MSLRRPPTGLLAIGALILMTMPFDAFGQSVQLDVHFKVTDLNNAPLRGIPVRLVLGPRQAWPPPDAGTNFVTDANGEYRFTTSVVLEERRVKRPTNFVSSLVSGRERTRHITVAAEMPYMQYRWLYAFDVDCFERDATSMLQGFTVLSRDARGQFTLEARRDKAGGWSMPELNGMMLSRPAFEPSNHALQPVSSKPGETHWTLDVAFTKAPDAVRR